MSTAKMISYPFAAAVAASLVILFLGLMVFGFAPAQWAEWQGRIVGVFGTLAGIAGSVAGVLMASHDERHAIK